MDAADSTRSTPEPSRFYEAVFQNTAATTADVLLVLIPEFSADLPFGDPDGVVWTPIGDTLPQAGDRALVAESTDGSWWVLSWWADTQSAGASQDSVDALDTRLDALEAGPEAFTAVAAFTNSWVNFDTARPARYYRANGRVYLEGLIKSGTVGAAAFTLPSGYRHALTQALQFPVVSNDAATGVVLITSDGAVTPYIGSNVYFDLSAISFRHA